MLTKAYNRKLQVLYENFHGNNKFQFMCSVFDNGSRIEMESISLWSQLLASIVDILKIIILRGSE